MIKKGFSLLEVIFVITIIGVIVTVAIPKLGGNLNKANMIKIKNDINMIRDGILQYRDKMILQNNSTSLETLEDDNQLLFNKILTYPMVVSNEQKSGSWSKISDTTYSVIIDTSNSVDFIYDKVNYTFDCNQDDELCKELSQ